MENDEHYVLDKKYLVVEKTNQDDYVFDKNNLHDKNQFWLVIFFICIVK